MTRLEAGGGVLYGREQEGCAQRLGLGGHSASHGGARTRGCGELGGLEWGLSAPRLVLPP